MRRLEERNLVPDVRTRRHPEAADLRRAGVGEVVAVQVGRREDVVIRRPGEDLLKNAVGNPIVDEELALPRRPLPHFLFRHDLIAEFRLGDLVAPVTKRALRELHDVALVHDREDLPVVGKRVLNRHPDEPFRSRFGHRFDANAGIGRDPLSHLPGQEFDEPLGLRRAPGKLDARVHVFRVFAEDDDVHPFGMRDRRRRTVEVADRTDTRKQVEHLTHRHVQTADAPAHRRRQRTFDGDFVGPDRLNSIDGQPLAGHVLGFLAREDLEPRKTALPAERLRHGGVEHAGARAPDVRTGAVAFDERNDRIGGHDELPVLARDRRTACRRFQRSEVRHNLPELLVRSPAGRGRFPRTLWKSLWKRHSVYAVVMRSSERSSGLHHSRASRHVRPPPATKTHGLYLQDRGRVERYVLQSATRDSLSCRSRSRPASPTSTGGRFDGRRNVRGHPSRRQRHRDESVPEDDGPSNATLVNQPHFGRVGLVGWVGQVGHVGQVSGFARFPTWPA